LPARLHDLCERVDAPCHFGQESERLQVALNQLGPGRTGLEIGRGPARLLEVRARVLAEVHAPGREHPHVAPGERVRAHLALLEYLHIEAVVERREGGLEPDRTGADDG
jgi:hypothetical protein